MLRRQVYIVVGLTLLLLTLIIGCAPNHSYVYEGAAIEVGGDGQPIELVNNPTATDPSYGELLAFIRRDATDSYDYVGKGTEPYQAYVCSDFAEAVHNNAEAAGIRAAWVSIDFVGDDTGHACNAFETRDRGLVYVDCTGRNPAVRVEEEAGQATGWDKVAYIEIGKEYGVIGIDAAASPGYDFYEGYEQRLREYKALLADYNDEVTRYNEEMRGKIYYEGSVELEVMQAWRARLEAQKQVIDGLRQELGGFWFQPMGIVKETNLRW